MENNQTESTVHVSSHEPQTHEHAMGTEFKAIITILL
jgi:hypothetical protein